MGALVTQTEVVEITGVSLHTLKKIVTHLGIEPQRDSYDGRLKLYTPEQVALIRERTSRIKYTRKEESNG